MRYIKCCVKTGVTIPKRWNREQYVRHLLHDARGGEQNGFEVVKRLSKEEKDGLRCNSIQTDRYVVYTTMNKQGERSNEMKSRQTLIKTKIWYMWKDCHRRPQTSETNEWN